MAAGPLPAEALDRIMDLDASGSAAMPIGRC